MTVRLTLERKSRKGHSEYLSVAIKRERRMSEICILRWSDGDLERGFLRVGHESKSRKPRYVPINSVARAVLESHAPRFGPGGPVPHIFVNPRRKHAYRPKSVSHDFKKAVRKLAKEWAKKGRHSEAEALLGVSFHTTRHTFASWLIQRGVPPAEIQQYLGHSSDTMTRRYAHLAPAMARGNTLEILVVSPNDVSVAKETCPPKGDAVNS